MLQGRENAVHFDRLNNNYKLILDERREFFSRSQHDLFSADVETRIAAAKDLLLSNDARLVERLSALEKQTTVIYTWGAAGLLFLAILEFVIRLAWR